MPEVFREIPAAPVPTHRSLSSFHSLLRGALFSAIVTLPLMQGHEKPVNIPVKKSGPNPVSDATAEEASRHFSELSAEDDLLTTTFLVDTLSEGETTVPVRFDPDLGVMVDGVLFRTEAIHCSDIDLDRSTAMQLTGIPRLEGVHRVGDDIVLRTQDTRITVRATDVLSMIRSLHVSAPAQKNTELAETFCTIDTDSMILKMILKPPFSFSLQMTRVEKDHGTLAAK